MKFEEFVSKMTGISTPVFGVSWKPSKSRIELSRKVIRFLEDRRVLYNPCEMEMPSHCIKSVIEIRHFLTDVLVEMRKRDTLFDSLISMRAACRKFIDRVGNNKEIVRPGGKLNHWASWEFNGAVGEMRGVFGIHIARIAVAYGIDIEANLASILPDAPVEEHV